MATAARTTGEPMPLAVDVVAALARLCDRAGATGFTIRWDCPHDDDDGDESHDCADVRWDASTTWQGTRLIVDDMPSPTTAALALAERLLDRATCRCGEPVTLSAEPGCRWQLVGDRWKPGCTAAPVPVPGARGDLEGMNRAMRRRLAREQQKKR